MSLYKLLDWIDISKIDWDYLSYNKNAIHLLERNFDKISWSHLSLNINAIHILEKEVYKELFIILFQNM